MCYVFAADVAAFSDALEGVDGSGGNEDSAYR